MKPQARPLFVAMVIAAGCLALMAAPAMAADPRVQAQAQRGDDGTWRLQATVTATDGRAVSQVPVTFLAATDFFGERWIPLGTASTDTNGVATLAYRPTWNGEQQLVARTGGAQAPIESAPFFIEVTGALPGISSEPEDLPTVRAWALPIGAAVVVAVWMVLAFLFFSAVFGIARRPRPKRSSRTIPVVDGLQPVESRIDGGPTT